MWKNILSFSFLLVFIVSSASSILSKPKNETKPNIVILFADDLGWVDVSTGQTNQGRGSKIYNTPNIDRIASEGMSFTNAYTQQNCAPSRASLISGQYATGVDNDVYNVTSLSRQDKNTKGFPNLSIKPYEQQKFITENGFNIFDMAKTAGYQTALVGKSHGTPHPLIGDYGIDLPGDIHHSINATVNGKEKQSYYLALNDDSNGWTFKSEFVNKYAEPYDQKYISDILAPFKAQSDLSIISGTAKHLTDAIGDFCVDYIKEKVDDKAPFLLYVPFHAVHFKVVGRKDLTAKYAKQGLDEKYAEYASMIELLDQNIGKIATAIKDPNGDGDYTDDISSNTLFIVYSDNGGVKGNGPLTGGKGVFTEGGIRVPLICRWPGVIAPNTVTNQAVHCIDFYPMLADFAGVDLSTLKKENGESVALDGISFADILTGENKRLERENLFWHFPGYMGRRLRPSTVIQKRVGDDYYKLFYYYETEKYLMYHVNEDLSEKNNLLENPSSQEMELALRMNHDMLEWLETNSAPTGTWVKDGNKVPYPKEDGVKKYRSKSKGRPNILFIMSDDHAYQAISAYNDRLIQTPNIDRLAKEGILFTNACVTNSICAPSRATILTGKHTHINGKIDNVMPFDTTQLTFPQLFQKAGYETAMYGKLHFGNNPKGVDDFMILPGQGNYINPSFNTPKGDTTITGYVTDIITDLTIEWLDKKRSKDKPFMMMYLHKAPHRPWWPSPKKFKEFSRKTFPEPESLFDDYKNRGTAAKTAEMNLLYHMKYSNDSKIKPEIIAEMGSVEPSIPVMENNFSNIYKRMNREQRALYNPVLDSIGAFFKNNWPTMNDKEKMRWKYQRYMQDYLGCISSVDDNVGRVLDYLDESGLAENTLVVYTSDQGFYLGEHGWFDKRFIYDESFKTPLLVRWPNQIKPGTTNDEMVQNLDFAQTFLEAAQIDAPDDMQGESLMPLLKGNNKEWTRDAVYYHYYEYPGFHMVKRHYGIVTKEYKLAHFYYDVDEWELYDRLKDPQEMKNVYDDPEYAGIVKELELKLAGLRVKYKDSKDLDQMYIEKTK